jgi:hypothetical protein
MAEKPEISSINSVLGMIEPGDFAGCRLRNVNLKELFWFHKPYATKLGTLVPM